MDVRVLFVPVTEIEIVDTWHTSGMRGTGSNSVVAHEVVVPADLVISPFAPAWIDRPLYRIPAFTLASTGAAPIVVGVAQAALDELVHLATGKASDDGQVLARRPHVQTQVAEMQTALHAARLALLDAAAAIDGAAIAAAPVDELLRARLRAAMSHAAAVSRQVLQGCQLLASSSAVYTGTAIERLVRDGIVAAQHMILSPTHSQILGRLTFGFEAGTPVV
jgi:alkylation response protein AidB-like acyl-CoA dehydrogenase